MKRCPICRTVYPNDANFCPMDAGRLDDVAEGPPAATPSLDLPTMQSRQIGGRFRLGPQLGGRRTGEVYAADDLQNGQSVAVKVIAPAVFPTPLVAQRTERELKQLMKVGSDRVARIYDVGRLATPSGERMYVAMELVSGTPLADIIAAQGPLGVETAVRIGLEIGEALAEAAKLGVIHRDVSPKNVLIVQNVQDQRAPGLRVKLINFGIPTPVTDKVLGIPEFLSPEQAEGKPVDQRSNIYSLGAQLYTMLTGAPPFVGETDAVLRQQTQAHPPPPSQRVQFGVYAGGSVIPPDLDRLILKALEKSSSRRHLTLRQLLGELESILPQTQGLLAQIPPRQLVMPAGPPPAYPSQPPAYSPPPQGAYPPTPSHGAAPPRPSTEHPTVMAGPSPAGPPPAAPPHQSAAKTMIGMTWQPPPPPTRQPAVIVPDRPPAMIVPDAPPPVVIQPQYPYRPPPAHQPTMLAPQPPPVMPPPMRPAPMMPPQPTMMAPPQPPPPAAAGPVPQPGGPPRGKAVAGNRPNPSRKGKFRETMWFKKGELDEAVAAGAETPEAPARVDELPIEDRYKDDGTLTADDRDRLSLRTGGTQVMPAMQAQVVPGERMDEDALVGELKGGRTRAVLLVVGALVVAAMVIVYFAVLRH